MPHREYIRLVPGANTAVLFLHGIVGTPRHFDCRLPLVSLVPENWSVYSLLLPGHGGCVKDFSASTMAQWKAYVWKTFDRLSQTHRRVILAGHSMGTLFAIQLAVEKGEKIPFLFLLAVPLCPQVSLAGMGHCLSLTLCPSHSKTAVQAAMFDSGSVTLTKRFWKYIPWLPNLLSLLKEAQRTKKLLPALHTKALVFQSRKDEMVARRSAKYLAKSPFVQLSVLKKSTHFYYDAAETKAVQQAFIKACREVAQ